MSRDDEAKSDRLFDIRAIERNIRKGLITRKDYDKHLKSLPDVTDKIAPKDAPVSHLSTPTPRPVEYAPPTIIIHPAPPSENLDLDSDLDDEDDEEDDDLEELDDDDLDEDEDKDKDKDKGEGGGPAPNGTSEEPPKD